MNDTERAAFVAAEVVEAIRNLREVWWLNDDDARRIAAIAEKQRVLELIEQHGVMKPARCQIRGEIIEVHDSSIGLDRDLNPGSPEPRSGGTWPTIYGRTEVSRENPRCPR